MNQKNSSAFIDWLNRVLKERGLTDYQLAKQAGISHTVLSKARSGLQPVGWKACISLADALGIPQSELLILAGHLEKPAAHVPGQAEWDALFNKLTPADREEFAAMIQARLARRDGRK